jgi:hypothetical protein
MVSAVLLAVVLAACSQELASATGVPKASKVRHVFIIVLENESYSSSFGPHSRAPYLARKLVHQGHLLPNYYGVGHESLDNYIAMVSGQGPNLATQGDCPRYVNVRPGTMTANGQSAGTGCVYAPDVQTIANQLTAAHLTWRGYMQSMPKPCDHPAPGGQPPPDTPKSQYAPRHDPFVFFHSITDHGAYCNSHVVRLNALPRALRRASRTPNLSFITPNVCNDGHDSPCADGRPGGLATANAFLRAWVPRIMGSPAYRRNGLLVILFDEASSSDSSACCSEQDINSPAPGIDGPGGGRVGAVLLSPFLHADSVDRHSYNHYSLLRTLENVFGLRHLGYAAQAGQRSFAGVR